MKSLKNLLVPAVILIALVIGVIVYFIAENSRNNEPSESSAGQIDIIFLNNSDISSLSVTNNKTGFTSAVKCNHESSGTVIFEYQGDDAIAGENYSQWKLSEYVYDFAYFSGYSKVSSADNLAEFGLDNPQYTVNIDLLNGSATTIYIGNKSPDGSYCYVYVAGTSDIYTIASTKLDQASKTSVDFLENITLSIDYSDLKNIHFDRKTDNLSLDLSVNVNDSGNNVIEVYKPYHHGISSYFRQLLNSITNLKISEYVDISKDELSAYGLDNPAYHFVLTKNNGEKTELYFSEKIGTFYYGYMTGFDGYFKLSESQITGLEMQETVLIYSNICFYGVKDISKVLCEYGDKTFKFEINVPDGENISSSEATVSLDGRNASVYDSNGRSYAAVLYESLTQIKIAGVELNANINTSSGPVFSITFVDNAYNSTVYDFYTRNDNSYYVFKDGEYMNFYVYSKEIFYNAGTDTYNYGCWSAYELLSEAITKNINGTYDIPTE